MTKSKIIQIISHCDDLIGLDIDGNIYYWVTNFQVKPIKSGWVLSKDNYDN